MPKRKRAAIISRMLTCFVEADMKGRTLKHYQLREGIKKDGQTIVEGTNLPIMTVYRYLNELMEQKLIRMAKARPYKRTGQLSREFQLTDRGRLIALVFIPLESKHDAHTRTKYNSLWEYLREYLTDDKIHKVVNELRAERASRKAS
jgi:predicted transcriptional regulator